MWIMLTSPSIIIIASLLAYNRITYEFPLAVGNTGQSALGPPTSAGVGIVYAMIVIAAVLGFGTVLSIFGPQLGIFMHIVKTNRARGSSPTGRVPIPPTRDEWEESPTKEGHESLNDQIIRARLDPKRNESATTA